MTGPGPVALEVFSGGGGAVYGLLRAGCRRVIAIDTGNHAATLAKLGPAVEFHRMDWREGVERFGPEADVITGGPPCFPAGTPVVTARGVVGIESVAPGDLVLTHAGRWRPVTATMSRQAEVWVSGYLAATADHPFMARQRAPQRFRKPRELATPGWVPAAETQGSYLATPREAERLPIPSAGRVPMAAPFWYMVGRWLGDGWLRVRAPSLEPHRPMTRCSRTPRPCAECAEPAAPSERWPGWWRAFCGDRCRRRYERARRSKPRADVIVCCADEEADGLESKLADTSLRWCRSQERTVTRFTLTHAGLTAWLAEHFGRYAYGKTIPGWLLGAPPDIRRAVLDGYLDADGHTVDQGGGLGVNTVSATLAVGARLLAASLGYPGSLTVGRPDRDAVIEGRPVRERPLWRLTVAGGNRLAHADGPHWWMLWRRPWLVRGREAVYDLTVEDDHSFIAWGLVVHNCQYDSNMSNCRPGLAETYPDLVEPFRAAIEPYGVPWWIEQPVNRGARRKLRDPIMLCGQHFGLTAANDAGVLMGLQRHRLFASGTPLVGPGKCRHTLPRLPVYGHGAPGNFPHKGPGLERAMREGMRCGWMPRAALAESIPWLYAAYVAGQLLATDPRLARFGLGAGWADLAVTATQPQLI